MADLTHSVPKPKSGHFYKGRKFWQEGISNASIIHNKWKDIISKAKEIENLESFQAICQ